MSRRRVGSGHFEPVFSTPGRRGDSSLAGRIVQTLFEASDGRIWAGTQQGDLAIIDPATNEGRLVDHAQGIANQGGVSSLVEAPGGQMWVGRSAGIELYGVRDGRLIQRLQHDLRRPAGLAGNEVTALMLDHAGAIWVGGFGLGLQRHDPSNRSIWLRGADLDPHSPLFVPDVRSLLQLSHGEIWAATHKGGVAVMDGELRVAGTVRPQGSRKARTTARALQPPPLTPVEAMTQGWTWHDLAGS